MIKFMFALVVGVMSFSSMSMATETEVKETQNVLIDRLQVVYDNLYSIDYRKLEIDDFKKYSEVLKEIDSLKADFTEALKQNSVQPQIKFSVYEETATFYRNWNNGCHEYKQRLLELVKAAEENGIRQCYQQGGNQCDIKIPGRIKAIRDLGLVESNYTCEVKLDVVITGTF